MTAPLPERRRLLKSLLPQRRRGELWALIVTAMAVAVCSLLRPPRRR
jgi:hypothetical protein